MPHEMVLKTICAYEIRLNKTFVHFIKYLYLILVAQNLNVISEYKVFVLYYLICAFAYTCMGLYCNLYEKYKLPNGNYARKTSKE